MTDTLAQALFWLSIAGVVFHYVGYPVVIGACARLFGRRESCPEAGQGPLPFVSIVVAALNEEEVIEARVANALATEYPADRMEIVVASDGSVDRTVALVQAFADPRVRVIAFPQTRGKARVLNDVIPTLRGDLVLLSDANTFIEPGVAHRMARWFTDRRIGCVVGRLVLTDAAGGRNVDGMYWRYETFLKESESALGALLGANGAIYAIRRALFVPLPEDTLVDDFVLPLLITLRSGARSVYDTVSVAHEELPERMRSEVKRRSRIGAGAFGSIRVLWPLVHPRHGWTAFAYASHKLLRWVCPFLLVTAFVMNLALASAPPYGRLLVLQVLFYATAAIGAVLPGRSLPVRILRLTTLFAGMNAALLVGFWRWAAGERTATWQRTARAAKAADAGNVRLS